MEFIALFKTWTDLNAQKGLGKTYTKGHIGNLNVYLFKIFLQMIILLSS